MCARCSGRRPALQLAESGYGGVDELETDAGPLGAVAADPPDRGGVEAVGLGVADDQADLERVVELDPRELGGRGADEMQVARLERAAEPCVG